MLLNGQKKRYVPHVLVLKHTYKLQQLFALQQQLREVMLPAIAEQMIKSHAELLMPLAHQNSVIAMYAVILVLIPANQG